jgi:TIR domain-containing protein
VSAGPGVPAPAPAPKLFISYRRGETAAHAGRLYDAIVGRFDERNVFMDLDLAPGVDFVERITDAVAACHVLLVIIGPRWATVEDEDGGPRLADPEDYVRLEVATALRRSDVTVIPVLVAGAQMPDREELPPQLQAITRRNAVELTEARWRYDVGRLMSALDQPLAELTRTDTAVAAAEARAPRPSSGRLILEGMLVGGLAALVANALALDLVPNPAAAASEAGAIARVLSRRAGTWAAVGVALGLWLALRAGRGDPFRGGTRGLIVGAIAGAIGGAIYAAPVFLHDPQPLHGDTADWINVGSFAATGAIVGGLVGTLWLPRRLGAGLASGLIAGALIELILNRVGSSGAAAVGVAAAAIVGVTLATLVGLGARAADS